MKFKDIKVGDKVLCGVDVRGLSIFDRKTFLIAKEVTRVTKTQFIADGKRFSKDYGKEVGGSGRANLVTGCNIDQSEDLVAFEARVKLIRTTLEKVDNLRLESGTDEGLNKLMEIIRNFTPTDSGGA